MGEPPSPSLILATILATTVNLDVPKMTEDSCPHGLHLLPPDSHQFLGIQHDVKAVMEFVWIVHGPLVHVALHGAGMPGVLTAGDLHPVAASSHPSHAWDGIG